MFVCVVCARVYMCVSMCVCVCVCVCVVCGHPQLLFLVSDGTTLLPVSEKAQHLDNGVRATGVRDSVTQ